MRKKRVFDKYVVLGQNSRIALDFYDKIEKKRIVSVDRKLYDHIALQNNLSDLFMFLSGFSNTKTVVLIFAGITDSKSLLLSDINYIMPLQIVKFCDFHNISTATFGTVMENQIVENPYVTSKKKLLDGLIKNSYSKHFHFQLNTIYGNEIPPRNMFLGEMIECIQNGDDFNMSSGLQYREYQSSKDCIQECIKLIEKADYGVQEINLNQDFRLRELAEFVFLKLGIINRLRINGKKEVKEEIFNKRKSNYSGKSKEEVFSEVLNYIQTKT
jgi:hypothetical protein